MEDGTVKKSSFGSIIVVAIISACVGAAVMSFVNKKAGNTSDCPDITGSWYSTYSGQTFVLTLKKDKTFEYGYEDSEMTTGTYSNTSDVIKLVTDNGTDKIVYDLGKDFIEISSTKYYNKKDTAVKNDAFYYVPDDYDISMFKKITASEMVEKFNKGEEAFVLTARGSCGYCQQFRPVAAKSVETYNYTLYYLDTTSVTQEDYEKITALDGFSEFGSTPNVFYFKNKAVVDIQQGAADITTYGQFLEKNGVKKK